MWKRFGQERDGTADANSGLFDEIGRFLIAHALDPDPQTYAFVHHILSEPMGDTARAVQALIEDGVRLTQRDLDFFGLKAGVAGTGPRPSHDCNAEPDAAAIQERLAARTQMQAQRAEDLMRAVQTDTQAFGRDLAASADAIESASLGPDSVGDMVRLARVMIDRVQHAEQRLERATSEAGALRAELDEARDDARRDPLTDLPNRRAFEEAFGQAMRSGCMPQVALCDIDRFKSVNDRFGHAVGDRVLCAVAEQLAEACEGHMVARYGGEEFVVLFDGLDPAAAHRLLDEARRGIAAKRWKLRETAKPLGCISFSAGLAGAQAEDDALAAICRADALLYDAKAQGRNRVCTA